MFTISQLVKKFELSRSTLLYYDKIGLLKPSARSKSNYRLYSPKDIEKMTLINTYRTAGLSLEDITTILNNDNENQVSLLLEQRLENLNMEVNRLREQQKLIVSLLGNESLLKTTKVMNKSQWVKILKSSGMNEDDMRRWHIEFEKDLPEVHTDFLQSLGIDSDEIARIKTWSKQ
ncbi:MAG: MerR family transcriptional regulator [Kangiellaceae bacterium]